MSGHSKWATTKHKKGAKDAARAKSFAKLIRQVEVAAREGGGDVNSNATLRTMFAKARDSSVPLDTIERAIKRGTGELEGVRYEAITYEGYAPGGVAVIVETLTDNRNRTSAEVRHLFSKNGGSMAEPGAVSWQFERRGVIVVDRTAEEDALMEAVMDVGGEDLADDGSQWTVTCEATNTHAVKVGLEAAGFTVVSAEPSLVPSQTVPVTEHGEATKLLRLLDAIDDHDDVQAVHANADIPDEILETYEG